MSGTCIGALMTSRRDNIIVKDEKGELVADPTVLWRGGGTISPSY